MALRRASLALAASGTGERQLNIGNVSTQGWRNVDLTCTAKMLVISRV